VRRVVLALGLLAAGLAGLGRESDHTAPAIPSGPDPAGYWGFALGLHPEAADRRGFAFPPDVDEVRATGATHVLLPVSWTQDGVDGTALVPGRDTLADDLLVDVVRRAHAAGLGTILLPIVEIRGAGPKDWRGVIEPRDRARWWRSYARFVLRYARIAREEGVAMLVIGSELTSMSTDRDAGRWAELAERVRAVYPGPLAYGANHDALDLHAPFAHVDVVGVSAYFPLARDRDAPPEALRESWRRHAERLRLLHQRTGKPVVVLEVGYPSVDGAAVRPWDYTSGAPIDLEEQRAAYAALADAVRSSPWLHGVLLWHWLGPGGPHDRWYTPRNKPAAHHLPF